MTGQRYVIELQGEPAGIVVGERAGFRFYAVQSHFSSLENCLFRSPGQAEHACRELAEDARASSRRAATPDALSTAPL